MTKRPGSSGGLLSRADLEGLRRRHGAAKVVFTNGCFDVLHPGHVDLLERARGFGDVLVVGINGDASVRRLKGSPRPFMSAADRARILLAFSAVDYVTVFDEDTPLETIEALRPDVLVKGAEYGPGEIVGARFVEEHGGRVERVEMTPGQSTTALVEKIRSGS